MKLVKVEETCAGCPSQWDAWTDEGDYVYMRYRHGRGIARKHKSQEAAEENWQSGVVADFRYGHELDGVISLSKFCELAGLEIADNADIKLWPPDDFYDALEALKGW